MRQQNDPKYTIGLNPTAEQADLLTGLHHYVCELENDDIIGSGEWWWMFLQDFAFYIRSADRDGNRYDESFMRITERILSDSTYDLDIEGLRTEGANIGRELDDRADSKQDRSARGQPSEGHPKRTLAATLRKWFS